MSKLYFDSGEIAMNEAATEKFIDAVRLAMIERNLTDDELSQRCVIKPATLEYVWDGETTPRSYVWWRVVDELDLDPQSFGYQGWYEFFILGELAYRKKYGQSQIDSRTWFDAPRR